MKFRKTPLSRPTGFLDNWDVVALQVARLVEEHASWHMTFSHTHATSMGENPDICAKCGLDLRDRIHLRYGKAALRSRI